MLQMEGARNGTGTLRCAVPCCPAGGLKALKQAISILSPQPFADLFTSAFPLPYHAVLCRAVLWLCCRGFKALKQIIKIQSRLSNHEEMVGAYRQLLQVGGYGMTGSTVVLCGRLPPAAAGGPGVWVGRVGGGRQYSSTAVWQSVQWHCCGRVPLAAAGGLRM